MNNPCFGLVRNQDISSLDINFVAYKSLCLSWGKIAPIFATSLSKNYREWKCTFLFPKTIQHVNGRYLSNRWFNARLQYLQCVSNGDAAILHWAIEIILLLYLVSVLSYSTDAMSALSKWNHLEWFIPLPNSLDDGFLPTAINHPVGRIDGFYIFSTESNQSWSVWTTSFYSYTLYQ